jgi:photosystem I P700 chlorophyll a apoprotein A1
MSYNGVLGSGRIFSPFVPHNYEAWLSDPTHIGPSAQVVWPIVGQKILNGDVGGGFRGIQRTSGFFQILIASKFNLLTKVVLQSLTQIS